jgi:hypothetical protein
MTAKSPCPFFCDKNRFAAFTAEGGDIVIVVTQVCTGFYIWHSIFISLRNLKILYSNFFRFLKEAAILISCL